MAKNGYLGGGFKMPKRAVWPTVLPRPISIPQVWPSTLQLAEQSRCTRHLGEAGRRELGATKAFKA